MPETSRLGPSAELLNSSQVPIEEQIHRRASVRLKVSTFDQKGWSFLPAYLQSDSGKDCAWSEDKNCSCILKTSSHKHEELLVLLSLSWYLFILFFLPVKCLFVKDNIFTFFFFKSQSSSKVLPWVGFY